MGLSKEEAYKIMGLSDGAPKYKCLARYRKLAYKYHPEKNPANKELAIKKFRKIVSAYVRLQIDPDDCDQMKMKIILAELYDINEDVISGHYSDLYQYSDIESDDSLLDDDELDSPPTGKGPYCEILQDFLIRSYMSGGRKTKPQVAIGPKTKTRATEAQREKASRQAEELLQAEAKKRQEEEKRRNRNKRKKEAKKRKKVRHGAKPALTNGDSDLKKDSDKDEEDDVDHEEASSARTESGKVRENSGPVTSAVLADAEDNEDSDIDWDSAFIAHATTSKKTKPAKKKAPPSAVVSNDSLGDHSPITINKNSTAPIMLNRPADNVAQRQPGSSSNGAGDHLHKQGNSVSAFSSSSSAGGGVHNGSVTPVHNTALINPSLLISKEDDDGSYDADIEESKKKAVLGNRSAKEGLFQEAISYFTEAIELYPFDHRYHGNRSFCYDYIQEYRKALEDACNAISLKADWPKGYYRKGRALAGLKCYEQAGEAYEKALELDSAYHDAAEELKKLKVEQLTNMGFDSETSKAALESHGSLQAAVDAILTGEVKCISSESALPGTGEEKAGKGGGGSSKARDASSFSETYKTSWSNHANLPPRLRHLANPNHSVTLWVGNIKGNSISEGMLYDLFRKCGSVHSVRLLPERYCAFVNYHSPECASIAMKQLQGALCGGCTLLLRFPDNPGPSSVQPSVSQGPTTAVSPAPPPAKKNVGRPVNGNECFYWRLTGCSFGDKCRYRHIPKNRGIDLPNMRRK